MEYIKRNLDAIIEYLDGLDDESLVDIHNQYCNENNTDDTIYYNDEDFFNTMFSNVDEAVRAVCYGEYNYTDKYVTFNGYANLVSFNYPDDHIDVSEIAQDILDNEQNYYNIELEDDEDDD